MPKSSPDREAEGRPRRMLEQIRPVKAVLERTQFLPPVLAPLTATSAIGHGIEDAVLTIARRLGFDNFMYGAASALASIMRAGATSALRCRASGWLATISGRT